MKMVFELLDESTLDLEDLQAERDMQLAAVDAIRRARRFGAMYVIWEEDAVKEIPPDKTAPYEARLLASAASLDRRISEMQITPRDLALNDRSMDKK